VLAWIVVLSIFTSAAGAGLYAARGQRRLALWMGAVAGALGVFSVLVYHRDLAMQKGLSALIMPLGWLWIGLAAAAILAFGRGQRALGWMSAGLFGLHTLGGNVWVSGWMIGLVEAQQDAVGVDAAPALDAVLVLGGGAGLNHRGEPQLYDPGDRVLGAARLWHSHRARTLVISGSGIEALNDAIDLTESTARLLREIGVDEAAILKLPEPKNTSQELAAFARLVRERGFQRVGVLTSSWHLPRAMRSARREGLSAVPIAVDRRTYAPPAHPSFVVPTAMAWRWSQAAVWEWVGMAVGR
jgi:uncharacterized SAM-binding protein YcdF (DUF218 family)